MSLRDTSAKLARSFIAVVSTDAGPPFAVKSRLSNLPNWQSTHLISADRRAELAFVDADASPQDDPLPFGGRLTLVVGDDAEWEEAQGDSCMACATCVEWDSTGSRVRVLSSIVGLPPIFILRLPSVVAVASELHLFGPLLQPRVALLESGAPVVHTSIVSSK
jgi:hypothetical protein